MILYNCVIFTMNDQKTVIENGYIEIDLGKIKKIGEGMPENITDEDIDLSGMCVYPGFIDLHTHMGLMNSGVGVEGEDFNEDSDPVTPQLNVIDAINPMDITFTEASNAGVTTVAVAPGSTNTIAGNVVAIKTLGKRVDSMVLKEIGVKFALGENPKMTYLNKDEAPVTRMAIASLIRETLTKAVKYKNQLLKAKTDEDTDEPDFDAKLHALIPLLNGETKAHFHCHSASDIFTALRISKEFGIKPVLIHCTEGHLIADEITGCEAVIGPIISDRSKPELKYVSLENARILTENKCRVAVCTDHSEVPIQYLPISAGLTMRGGLTHYNALETITCTPAKIGGIYDRVGSIEEGKDADLCVFSENPLELLSEPQMVFINGRKIR
ncbi:MAG: amidohydrolase family protein [Oscillospiraceae bacterium]|nr:amidohydrolase family protein [Oscillospiraceae bacterium]